MKLAWSVSEEQQFPSREIVRNCGPLLGRLDELLPCLYIAQYGASSQDLRARITDAAPGLFAVGARTGGAGRSDSCGGIWPWANPKSAGFDVNGAIFGVPNPGRQACQPALAKEHRARL